MGQLDPIFAMVDWGTVTGKDLVYAGAALAVLVLGHRRAWCWYYQLEEVRAGYQKQLDDANKSHAEQVAQLRTDFVAQLTAAERRAEAWRELVMEGRLLVRQSVETTAELAKRHAV